MFVSPATILTFDELAKNYVDGFALPREFYTSPSIFEYDIHEYWNKNWVWAGHVSQIPKSGQYFLFEYATESIIVLRDKANQVRAYINVCRHRGSRVCLEKSGTTSVFSCPYHAWTYDLQGRLRSGREMEDGFDRSAYGLLPAQVKIFQGLIFVCLSPEAPQIDTTLAILSPLTQPFGLADLKVAHTASYRVPANWKLALENYLECYHCAPSHWEYSKSHSLKDPKSMTGVLMGALSTKSKTAGLPDVTLDKTGHNAKNRGADAYYRRYPLYPGYLTGSKTGEPLAPILGDLTQFDGGATDIMIGPLNNFLAYSDYIVGYRFVPVNLQLTDIQVVWMVRRDAENETDYKIEDLTWLWHVTSQDDEKIIRYNQSGVNSSAFIPGPLSKMEWGIRNFYHGYLGW